MSNGRTHVGAMHFADRTPLQLLRNCFSMPTCAVRTKIIWRCVQLKQSKYGWRPRHSASAALGPWFLNYFPVPNLPFPFPVARACQERKGLVPPRNGPPHSFALPNKCTRPPAVASQTRWNKPLELHSLLLLSLVTLLRFAAS